MVKTPTIIRHGHAQGSFRLRWTECSCAKRERISRRNAFAGTLARRSQAAAVSSPAADHL